MPVRDDYAMLCYGFYLDFKDNESAMEFLEKLESEWHQDCKKDEEHEECDGIDCNSLWEEQFVSTPENKNRVFIYRKECKFSVGSRTGEFQVSFEGLPEFSRSVIMNGKSFACRWHLVMWGPFFN